MKLYLSSYELGNHPEALVALYGSNRRVGYVPNARDFIGADPQKKAERTERDMAWLSGIGLVPELLDLREYFARPDVLRERLSTLGGVWVSGGNMFVLRQAMRLSGFDSFVSDEPWRDGFVYGGYSAAGCALGTNLRPHAITDDANDFPYPEIRETIWEWLGLIPYAFEPHYRSDHSESESTDREIGHCTENKIPFIALRDGEALVLHDPARPYDFFIA